MQRLNICFKAELTLLILLLACSAVAGIWDFEGDKPGWADQVVDEDGAVSPNRALRINASRPHHTRVVLPDKISSAFVFEGRVKLQSTEGVDPAAYFYAITDEGFLALTLTKKLARLFYYRGKGKPSLALGQMNHSFDSRRWMRVKLAKEGESVVAKIWPAGGREAGWSMIGYLPDAEVTRVALGVWLPPDRKAHASMLFDDIVLRDVTSDDRVAVSAAPAQPLIVPSDLADGIYDSTSHIGVAANGLLAAFDRDNGSLRHLFDTATGRSFTARQQRRPLFRLRLSRWRKGDLFDITSDDFRQLAWRKESSGTLYAKFSDGPEEKMSVTARITAGADQLLHFSIDIENSSEWAVASIQYPCFAAPSVLGSDASDDRLLFPQSHTDGIVVNKPGTKNRHLHGAYPGCAAVQMMALYDASAGLLLATQDVAGHCKEFEAVLASDCYVELRISHLRPEVPGDGGTPYDTVMGRFNGNWRDAADLYKRWARRQFWCKRRLTQRDDIPAFLKESCAGVIVGLGSPNGYNGSMGPNLERIPELAAEYRKRTGVKHMIVVPYGWENRGTWAGINYFPPLPSAEAWRDVNKALYAQGDRVAMLTSGFWWVVRRPPTSGGPAFDDSAQFEQQKTMTVHRPDGTPWFVDNTDKAGTHGDWRGYSVKLCHGSPEARAVMLDIFLKTAGLGTPLISFDQAIGGGQGVPCYAADHGHPPGYGSWMWRDFHNLCEDIINRGRKINPEIGLFVENCGEMIIPVMSTYWSRQFGVLDSGSDGEGPVGLFSYLYHEYVTAMGAAMVQGQGPLGSRVSAGLRCQALAHNVTRGLIPCPFAHHVKLDPVDKWEDQVSTAFFAYCQPFASFPEYLLLGETLHPPRLQCEERSEWFLPKKNKGAGNSQFAEKRETRILPAAVAGRFKAPDGRSGTVVVNATAQRQQIKLLDLNSGFAATLYRADKSVEKSFDSAPAELSLELEPFGVRMLIEK